jgi:hypothetical protein
MTMGVTVFLMILHYFEGKPRLLNEQDIGMICVSGIFYFGGYLAGCKAERKAQSAVSRSQAAVLH